MISLPSRFPRFELSPRALSRVSRYTARFHLPAAGLEGLVAGVFTLNDIVLRKNFGAGPLLITLMVMAAPVSQLLSVVWGKLMEGREKRTFILGFGGVGRLALILVAFAATPLAFLIPVAVSITLATAIIPALNALYQTNYTGMERGTIFGWVLSLTALTTIVGSLAAGAWLDHDPRAFRIIYPVAGALGLAASYLYFRIRARRFAFSSRMSRRIRRAGQDPADVLRIAGDWLGDVQQALRNPWRGAREIFGEDRNFLRFEGAYMVYGLGFMVIQPVIPLFLVDEIKVQYAEAAMARGLIFWGVVSLASPFFGRLLDRSNAVRLSVAGFGMLALFPLLMAMSRTIGWVYGAFAVFGLAMAPVNIAWTMGPIFFARKKDAAAYMGVHVSMVGIRGLIGNPAGLLLMQTVGSRGTFLVSAALFATAAALMHRLNRRLERDATSR